MKKRALVSVTNDLLTDQRVHRTCLTLLELGFEPLLIGRQTRCSLALPQRSYSTLRMKLLFNKGPLFYAEFQLRLLILLLFKNAVLLYSNDLDTLMPNFIISKVKHCPIIYDSHEYFTGVPELQSHPIKKGMWKMIERTVIPHLNRMITVNDSIAALYHSEYGIEVKVVRNMPVKQFPATKVKSRMELGLPKEGKIILLQGAGINVDRGAEEAVQSMKWVKNAVLLIIGGGDAITSLKLMVQKLNLSEKVMFIPKLPFEDLREYTLCADIGLTLDKDTNLNYRYSLPNKLFDYIHAGVPVVASPLQEVKRIVEQYGIGECTASVTPEAIADKVNELLGDDKKLKGYKANTVKAKEELCWENERKTLEEVIRQIRS